MKNKKTLQIGLGAAALLVLLFIVTTLTDDTRDMVKVDTSVAVTQLDSKNVEKAQIDDREQQLRLTLRNPADVEDHKGVKQVITQYPARTAPMIFDKVSQSGADKYNTKVTKDSFLMSMISFLLPMIILFGFMAFFLTKMQTGGGMFGIGGNKAKALTRDTPTNTFNDVAGEDEAVDELEEVVDFLKNPARYEQLGAKIPRGVLLYGPPGTGKTLLARAVAGEAGVSFYSISGSDFVEMFVGVGASRVRDLFKTARENSPCIIFIDEIDAVGRQRGSGMGGGHDEREQTLNQLLVEMDGFGDREGVIIMAATNRPDILDPALLRPGRFDRQIPVINPDLAGREKILEVHSKGKPLGPDADLKSLAKRTAGMSGADLANVLNEAALLTARIGGNIITADALEEATDRVIGGPRRSSKIISEHEKKVTAYHEGGHTLSAWALEDIERVYKVTILARGRTGGHSMTASEDDKGMYNVSELYARLVFAMGGRAAEELVFGIPTTGASADIEQATKIARAMVTEYGMSPELGTVKFGDEQGDPFSGRGGGGSLDYSPEIAAKIDQQVSYLVDLAHQRSYEILEQNRDYLDKLAEKLLEKETLRRPDLEALFDGITPQPVGSIFPGTDNRFRQQPGREPVKTPVELAIERGEEPPKRVTLLEMSQRARAEREKAEQGQANTNWGPNGPSNQDGDAYQPTGRHAAPGPDQSPRYDGSQPPQGWTIPGWQQDKNKQDGDRYNPYASTQGQHPGVANYGSGEAAQGQPAQVDRTAQQGSTALSQKNGNDNEARGFAFGNEPMIGFRLPEREQPDHPERPDTDKHSNPAEPNSGQVSQPKQGNQPEETQVIPRHRDDER